jgi:hypothetical protein
MAVWYVHRIPGGINEEHHVVLPGSRKKMDPIGIKAGTIVEEGG